VVLARIGRLLAQTLYLSFGPESSCSGAGILASSF